ncbi:MAG: hypothetical protein WD181_06995 [Solirubrobacterales bacterium]
MALSEDSRSLLHLLLARGKSYGDIAELLGVKEANIRDRAHSALADIHGSDPDRDADLTDYLLGQADPIERAGTARTLAENPAARETADDLAAQLKLLVPSADLPNLPTKVGLSAGRSDRTRKNSIEPPADGRRTGFFSGLTLLQRRLLAILLLAATLIVVVLLAITLFDSDGDGEGNTAGEQPPATTAVLRPVEGQNGRGVVNFGFSGTELAAQLQFSELQPSVEGQSYVVWLYGPGGSFPINQATVDDAGAIAGQVAINQALICFIAGDLFPDVRLSRVENDEMRKTLNRARSGGSNAELPDFVGELVLEGPISMPQEAKDEILPVCNA